MENTLLCCTFVAEFGYRQNKHHRFMENNNTIIPLSEEFDFTKVPSWYVLCTNAQCPLRDDCLRYLAGQHAPDDLETALCVMPKTLKDGQCRWFDRKKVQVCALGFTHLYDRVLKKDYTTMRKTITAYLHGAKMYYEYKRGERILSQQQTQWIRNYVKSKGYDWDVPFDSYMEDYEYHHLAALPDTRK